MIQVNQNYFDNIDTPNKAYWLGYLFADGYTAQKAPWVTVIQTIDIPHLHQLASDLQYEGTIKYPKKSSGFTGGKQCGRLVVCRKHMCQALNTLGKNSLCMPELSNNLKPHFLRGFFDGDGSISVSDRTYLVKGKTYTYTQAQFRIIVHTELLPWFEELYQSKGWSYNISTSKTDYMKYISCGSKKVIQDVHCFMYTDAERYLSRKKAKFESALSAWQ